MTLDYIIRYLIFYPDYSGCEHEPTTCHPELLNCHPEPTGCHPEPTGCHPEPVEGRIAGIFAFISIKFKSFYSKLITGRPSTGSG